DWRAPRQVVVKLAIRRQGPRWQQRFRAARVERSVLEMLFERTATPMVRPGVATVRAAAMVTDRQEALGGVHRQRGDAVADVVQVDPDILVLVQRPERPALPVLAAEEEGRPRHVGL